MAPSPLVVIGGISVLVVGGWASVRAGRALGARLSKRQGLTAVTEQIAGMNATFERYRDQYGEDRESYPPEVRAEIQAMTERFEALDPVGVAERAKRTAHLFHIAGIIVIGLGLALMLLSQRR